MAADGFINNNLVKVRDKLSTDTNSGGEASNGVQQKSADNDYKPVSYRDEKEKTAIANERDWKKAVFKRWDEFKGVKKDIVNRLSERIASIPREIADQEGHTKELKQATEKYQKLLDDINALDDSKWNRHNFTAELASGMRKLENARIEFMMQASKTASPAKNSNKAVETSSSSNSIIHELNSLTFKQCFRIGFAFFMPLILGMLLAVFIWGLIYYLSLH